jgi:hypothetical protein
MIILIKFYLILKLHQNTNNKIKNNKFLGKCKKRELYNNIVGYNIYYVILIFSAF